MIRIALALLLAIHGVAHGVGFAMPWQLGEFRGAAAETSMLGGRLELGAVGTRIVGIAWLLAGIGFLVAAYGVWSRRSRWVPLTVGVAVVSLALGILAWPAAWIGVLVNLSILAFVSTVGRAPVI